MTLLDNREQRIIFLTEDNLMEVLGQAFEADGDFPPDNPRTIMTRLNPNFLKGDFRVFVPLNGKVHHTQVEEDSGASMIECNSVIKLGHRVIIIACDGMFIELASGFADHRILGLRIAFDGPIIRFILDTIWDRQENGQSPLYFAKSLNWQGEHIEEEGHAAIIELWEESPRSEVREFNTQPTKFS